MKRYFSFAVILVLTLVLLALSFVGSVHSRQGTQPLATVSAGEHNPVANAGNWSFIEPGDEVFLSALGSYDPDDDLNGNGRIDGNETSTLQLYEWDFEGDGVFDWSNESHGNVPHVYDTEGNYSATLRITDADGMRNSSVFLVFVYEDEDDEEDPEFSPLFFLGIALVEVVVAVGLVYTAYEIRRRYYTGTGDDFPVLTEKDEKKMAEERKFADAMEGQEPPVDTRPGEPSEGKEP